MFRTCRVPATSILLCLLTAGAHASAPPLTEADAVRRFLAESPVLSLGALRAEAARSAFLADEPAPNPALTYSIEDAGDTRDEFFIVEQALPIWGRRGLIKRTADRASTVAALTAEVEVRRAVHDLRSTFYEVLHGHRTLELYDDGAAQLQEVVAILREREDAGDAPGYDVIRAEQELAALGILSSRAVMEIEAASARLRSFFPGSPGPQPADIVGDFTLRSDLPTLQEAISTALSQRPDLLVLTALAEQRELEGTESRRRRLPDPVLALGVKQVESGPAHDSGYVATLTVPLPILDRGQHRDTRALAERQAIQVERDLLMSRIEAEVRAAHALATGAREAARAGAEMARRGGALLETARIAYDEGEHGILERLDALRSALQGRLLALEAGYEARRAEIDLDRATGTEVRPWD